MLNRLRNLLNPQQVAANVKTRGRASRTSSQASIPAGASAKAGQAAAGSAAAKSGFDTSKIIRNGILLVGGTVFLSRVLLDSNNPNSIINQALYPKGRGKYVLKIEKWEDKVSAYQTAYTAATAGVRAAINLQQRRRLSQQLGSKLALLTKTQANDLLNIAKMHGVRLAKINRRLDVLREKQLTLLKGSASKVLASIQEAVSKDQTTVDLESIGISPEGQALRTEVLDLLAQKLDIELAYMTAVEAVLMSETKTQNILREDATFLSRIKNGLLGLDQGKYEAIMERLSKATLLPSHERPKIFVLTFKGDIMASQVTHLREEITAIEAIADKARGDRVVVQLHSGGGTVTGYGLAANELRRIKNLGLPLDICVDEVAASGGYMMAAVADRIIAAPFAIVGSVGVVATIPNFSERLQREGVQVEDVTAGKFKRTMTPYKKVKEEDRRKMAEDIEIVLRQFKTFLKQQRPSLDVDKIATGETWQGEDALRLGLVDQLSTSDQYLSHLKDELSAEVLNVTIKAVQPRFTDALEDEQHASGSWSGMAQAWLANVVMGALRQVFHGNGPMEDLAAFHDYRPLQSQGVHERFMLIRYDHGYEPRL